MELPRQDKLAVYREALTGEGPGHMAYSHFMLSETRLVSDGEIVVWSRLVLAALAAQGRVRDARDMSDAHVLMLKSTTNLYDGAVVTPIGPQLASPGDIAAADTYVVAHFRYPLARGMNFSFDVPAIGSYFEIDYQQNPACQRIARHFGRLSTALSTG